MIGSSANSGRRRLSALAATLVLANLATAVAHASYLPGDEQIAEIVTQEIVKVLPPGGAGAAVAVSVEGRTWFFNFGLADRAARRPITSDSLFNLASLSKVFDVTLLAQAVMRGELSLDDPVEKYVPELRHGGDIRRVTLGELVSFTSGFSLPQDHPPWPRAYYTWPNFVRTVNRWKIDRDFERGKQYVYSHAGFMLLHVAMQRRFGVPYAALLEQRLLRPLGLVSTTLPRRDATDTARLAPALKRRAVQGYTGDGRPLGRPGSMGGYYHWPGTGQMFSSARDMATFLTAQLGETHHEGTPWEAIELTRREVAAIEPQRMQAHAWEIHRAAETIVDKNGGLHNTTTYIGMIPERRLGLVLLINRGNLNGRDIGHPILLRLAPAGKDQR